MGAHDPSDIVQGVDAASSDSMDDDQVLAQVDEREANGYATMKAEGKLRRAYPKDVGEEFENTVIPDEIDSRFDVVLEEQQVADSRNGPSDGVLHMVESTSQSNGT